MKKTTIKNEAAIKTAPLENKFTKSAIFKSKRFETRRDLLNVLLQDGKEYSISETERLINDYLHKEV